MTLDRAYLNTDEGLAVCCWNAPSKEAIEELFNNSGVKFEKITAVEEHAAETFAA